MLEFSSNIQIAGLTLDINPETYSKDRVKMGSFARTTLGNLIGQDVNAPKYNFAISGLTQTQISEIQLRAAADYNLALIDFVPISERGSMTRTIHELLETRIINGETVYRYIPEYKVAITNYREEYRANTVSYIIEAEEL
jgi:hypothetical protein